MGIYLINFSYFFSVVSSSSGSLFVAGGHCGIYHKSVEKYDSVADELR